MDRYIQQLYSTPFRVLLYIRTYYKVTHSLLLGSANLSLSLWWVYSVLLQVIHSTCDS